MSNAVHTIDKLIGDACLRKASDIHIDPAENHISVRFRVDGILTTEMNIDKSNHQEIISRLKILSGLRTDEHQAPQDGRFRTKDSVGENLDVRLSITPSYYGESAIMRLLRDTAKAPTLSDLGMSDQDIEKIKRVIGRLSGMILVTGPTGSGKTTTLYTILKSLNDGSNAIVTIEDPIEYAIPGVRQIQTNPMRGLTFASGLRSIVRQDPDIVMVGEIRDPETASIAIHTALTGHLLLSTMHTSESAMTLPRLMDMGVDPYLLASVGGVIIGERLVRTRCNCPNKEECKNCRGTGYSGRTGIFEVLEINPDMQNIALSRPTASQIRTLAKKQGMRTMEDDGLAKVDKKITTFEELVSAIFD